MRHKENAVVFKALCDEKRLEILEWLRDGEKCACVLIDQIDIAQSALSYHMKILCQSGIVESRNDGRFTLYRISDSGSFYAKKLLEELLLPNDKQISNEEYFAKLKANG